ncbi:MAG: glycosyltransferase [Lachnospiraceae bacterium]|nr:glycosyltransferase [Lachnospiraceae bacterium]
MSDLNLNTNDKIVVSVICLTYNHEKYIEQALKGFIAQKTDFKYEVIVHDDASTDNTQKIIKRYAKKYPDIIKPIYQKHNVFLEGKDIMFQYIFPQIKGKYIALCEGDDYWTNEHKLQLQVEYMEENPACSLCAHYAVRLDAKKNRISSYFNYDKIQENIDLPFIIENLDCFPTASMLYRKEFLVNNKSFIQKHIIFDYINKIMLATEGYTHLIPEYMSVYRYRAKGSWTNSTAGDIEKLVKHFQYSIEVLKDLDSYTKRKYHRLLKEEIHRREFMIAWKQLDYKLVTSNQFSDCYRKKRKTEKIIFMINIVIKKWNVLKRHE